MWRRHSLRSPSSRCRILSYQTQAEISKAHTLQESTSHLASVQNFQPIINSMISLTFLSLLLFAACDGDAFVNPKAVRFPRLDLAPLKRCRRPASIYPSKSTDDLHGGKPTRAEKIASLLSQKAAERISKKYNKHFLPIFRHFNTQIVTMIRISVPAIFAGVIAFFLFPGLALGLASMVNDAGVFAVLSQDSSQFVQNFLSVSGLLYSILAGQTYYFMYQQQEAVYYALFDEVTEAKSLLEQVALVCQGRSMYKRVLQCIQAYVRDDLMKLQADPAILLSARPADDPLETIMYMTSVGVPSTVYETVRSLRHARARRLGALQRKLPQVHLLLLWILAALELVSFPLLGAGTQTIGGYKLLTVEGILFAVITGGIVMTLRVSRRKTKTSPACISNPLLNYFCLVSLLGLWRVMASGRRSVQCRQRFACHGQWP